LCRFESGLRHHKDFKGLGSKSLALFCGGFWVGVHIGVPGVRFHAHQGLEFFPAHGVVSLKNAHGLVTAGRHDPKIVMPLKPPVIYEGMPQIVKVKTINPGVQARRLKGFPN
jgi:hypothetical protein